MNIELAGLIDDVMEAEMSPNNRFSAYEVENKKKRIREIEKRK